jgi:hypothetical protein
MTGTVRVNIRVETDDGDVNITKSSRMAFNASHHTDARDLLLEAVGEVRRALGIAPFPGGPLADQT